MLDNRDSSKNELKELLRELGLKKGKHFNLHYLGLSRHRCGGATLKVSSQGELGD